MISEVVAEETRSEQKTMPWPMVRIGSGVAKTATWSPRNSKANYEFPYIDLSSIDSDRKLIDVHDVSSIYTLDAPSRARKIVASGDVLVATVRPNLNGVAIVPREFDSATASTGYCVLRPLKSKLDGKYLYYWV